MEPCMLRDEAERLAVLYGDMGKAEAVETADRGWVAVVTRPDGQVHVWDRFGQSLYANAQAWADRAEPIHFERY